MISSILRRPSPQLFLALAIVLAGGLFSDVSARETVAYGPAPDWVEAPPIPDENASRREQAQNGVYYLLTDSQTQVRDDSYTYYRRTAVKVLNRSGLEDAARLQYSFDPADDVFTIHAVRLIRDGAVLDRLTPETAIVARRESDMANGVTDGQLTVYYEINDVRVGDIIDYAVSWENHSPIWPGQYSNTISLEWSVPVEHQLARVLLDENRPLTIKNLDTEAVAAITTSDGWREYRWENKAIAAVPGQDSTPQTYSDWDQVSVSTFSSWRDVTGSLLGAYESDLDLPADFADRHSWMSDQQGRDQRITAAIRYVQDHIRYVADETGVGSHLPRKPQEVIGRGWGDCKDKSLLLAAILRRMGVEAHVALTDLDQGYALPLQAPSPYAFDHAIVVISVDGRRYWIDPTNYEQGGVFPQISQPAYGFGLPIAANSDALISMEVAKTTEPQKTIREVYDFEEFEETGVTLFIESTYLGREADSFRRSFSASSLEKTARDYLKYYQGHYPGMAEAAKLEISDDRNANSIKTVENYSLAHADYAETDIKENFPLRADAVLNVFGDLNFSSRTAPIALPFPHHSQHLIVLKNIGQDFSGLGSFERENDYFRYSRKDTLANEDVTFSYKLQVLGKEAPLSASDDYEAITKDLNDWGSFDYIRNPGEEFDAEGAAAIAVLIAIIAAIIYLPFGIYARLKHDDAVMEEGVFHPVSMTKFVILNVASLGLYGIFWMWRCWRWLKRRDESGIKPFWRAFFSVIWFYPLFSAIREEQDEQKTPAFMGVILAIAYFIVNLVGKIGDRLYEDQTVPLLITTGISALTFLFVAPLVHWVNRLNAPNPSRLEENSRWGPHSFAALAAGVAYWFVIIYGAYAPE